MRNRTFVLFLLLLFVSAPCWAAGSSATMTYSRAKGTERVGSNQYYDRDLFVVNVAWVADDSDGSVPAVSMSGDLTDTLRGWYLYMIRTYSADATDGYSVDVNNAAGNNVVGDVADICAQDVEEFWVPTLAARVLEAPLTIAVSGNVVNEATGVVELYFNKIPTRAHQDPWTGEMYAYNNTTPITISESETYYPATQGTVAGYLYGFTFANGVLTNRYAGTYQVSAAVSISGSANAELHLSVSVDGAQSQNCHVPRQMGAAGDIGAVALT